jgi:predicted nucleotidyltransferase
MSATSELPSNLCADIVATLDQVLLDEDLVLLFGSAARGGLRGDSDIDLLIVSAVSHAALKARLAPVQKSARRIIDLTTYLPAEFLSLRRKHDVFLKSVLAGRHIMLKGKLP